jgi:hypothetical protein
MRRRASAFSSSSVFFGQLPWLEARTKPSAEKNEKGVKGRGAEKKKGGKRQKEDTPPEFRIEHRELRGSA